MELAIDLFHLSRPPSGQRTIAENFLLGFKKNLLQNPIDSKNIFLCIPKSILEKFQTDLNLELGKNNNGLDDKQVIYYATYLELSHILKQKEIKRILFVSPPADNKALAFFKNFMITAVCHDLDQLLVIKKKNFLKWWMWKLTSIEGIIVDLNRWKWLERQGAKIIFVSRYIEQEFNQLFPSYPKSLFKTIYNSINDEYFSPVEQVNNLDLPKPYFLHISSMGFRKNPVSILKAFLIFRKKYPEYHHYHLLFVGSAPANFKKLLLKNKVQQIHYLPAKTPKELKTIYKNAQAFIYPTKHDSFGLPALEAISCKTPVVLSNHPCLKELIPKNSAYFCNGSIKSILEQMYKIASQSEEKEKVRKDYLQIFRCETMSQKYIEWAQK